MNDRFCSNCEWSLRRPKFMDNYCVHLDQWVTDWMCRQYGIGKWCPYWSDGMGIQFVIVEDTK
jgi:hypothetical protein